MAFLLLTFPRALRPSVTGPALLAAGWGEALALQPAGRTRQDQASAGNEPKALTQSRAVLRAGTAPSSWLSPLSPLPPALPALAELHRPRGLSLLFTSSAAPLPGKKLPSS